MGAIISTKQEAAHTNSAQVSTCYTLWHFWEWSLFTGRGGYKTAGWASEVLPLQKRGGEQKKVLAMLKGGGGGRGHTKLCGSLNM